MDPNSEQFYIIGHRGAAGERFENSIEGFEHALGLDIAAIEIDIRQLGSEFWVMHDNDLERLTGASGFFHDLTDPSRLRLRNGEPIPSLRQVLDLTWGKMPLNIEIKSVTDLRLLLDLLAEYPAAEPRDDIPWNLISSFNLRAIVRLRQLDCPWPLAPISHGVPIQVASQLADISPYSWHFDNEYVDFELVESLRQQGVPSFVFTVNDVERARLLKQRGVAGIFTDYPSNMVQLT